MSEWYIEGGGVYMSDEERIFGRNIFIKPNDVDKIRNRFNNKDCYVTVFKYNKSNQQESDYYGPLYLDLDYDIQSEQEYIELKQDLLLTASYLKTQFFLKDEDLRIFFSGSKGFHIIIPAEILNVKPSNKLHLYYKYIATEAKNTTIYKTIDTKIYDIRRLFRITNSINSNTGLYKVPVTLEFVKNSTFEKMKEYATEPKVILYKKAKQNNKSSEAFLKIIEQYESQSKAPIGSRKNIVYKDKPLLPCIKNILIEGATKGQRNNVTMVLASSIFQAGYDIDETTDIIKEWNSVKNDPALSEKELITTINSCYIRFLGGKVYGCSSLRDLDLCIQGDCKLKK